MQRDARIYVAGHRGLVGSALVRRLKAEGYTNLVLRTSQELDLRDQAAVRRFFLEGQPEYVFLAAAKVGGILANSTYPADFIFENLAIQQNVIESAQKHGAKRLLFLGSSCIYPRDCPQPIKEEYLLTGPLELTNRPYALAKIAGIELCWASNRQHGPWCLAVMPTNLYGPGDNYDLQNSHVLPALIRKAHECKLNGTKKMMVWGSGAPRREFLYSDDMSDACVTLMNLPDPDFKRLTSSEVNPPIVNIGCGDDLTIHELAEMVVRVVGANVDLEFDSTKPDGTPRKLLDISRLNALGWKPNVGLEKGIQLAYEDFVASSKTMLISSPVNV